MKIKLTLRVIVMVVMLLSVLVVSVSYLHYRSLVKNAENNKVVLDSYTIIDLSKDLFTEMLDVESSQRGYIITKQPKFLASYNSHIAIVAKRITQLKALQAIKASQRVRLDTISQLWVGKLLTMNHNIALVKNGTNLEVIDETKIAEGEILMEQIRVLVERFSDRENELLRLKKVASSLSDRNSFISLIMAGLVVLVMFVIMFSVLYKENKERKQSEHNLYIKNQWFNQVLLSLGDGVIATDTQGMVTLINNAACLMLECVPQDAIGVHIEKVFEITNETSGLKVINPAIKALTENKICLLSNHTILRNKNGKSLFIDDSGAPIHNEQNELVGAVLIFRDVTEKKLSDDKIRQLNLTLEKKVEERTKESENRKKYFKALVENMHGAVTLINASGIIVYQNAAVEKIGGYPKAELFDSEAASFLHPDDLQSFAALFQELYSKPGASATTQYRILHKSGHYVWIEGTITNQLEDENIKAFVINYIDITERKKTEEQQALFTSIVNSSDDAIFSKTLDGIITSWNYGAEKLFGYTPAEIIGKHISLLIPSYLSHEEDTIIEKLKQGESLEHYETRRVRKDQSLLYVSLSISPIKDTLGNIIGASKIVRDITQSKEIEHELQVISAQQIAILNALPANIALLNLEGIIISVNNAWEVFGKENGPKSLHYNVGDNYLIVSENATGVDKVTGLTIAQGIREVLKGNLPLFSLEYTCHSPTEERWFQVNVAPSKNGNLSGAVVMHVNITDRKKAEEKIIESEVRLSEAQTVAQVGSWEVVYPSLNIIWSDETYRIFELTRNEFDSSYDGFLKFIYPEDYEKINEPFLASLATPSTLPYAAVHRIVTPTGKIKIVEEKWRVYTNQAGEPLRAVGTCQDITERKKAENIIAELNESLEQKVEERTRKLKEANEGLETFSYTVSHDLQSPLRSINGFTDILLNDYADSLPQEAKEFLSIIDKSTKRMSELIRDLLDFSKLNKGEIVKKMVDMNSIVSAVIAEVEAETPSFKPTIKLHHLEPALCDAHLIRQVWSNLIGNAIKYSSKKENALIEIGMQHINGEDAYYIKDNGAGFEMQYAGKLFGVFQRMHHTDEFEGTGVGLATVHRIITRFGGKVWAEAELNKGAIFYFILPKNQKS